MCVCEFVWGGGTNRDVSKREVICKCYHFGSWVHYFQLLENFCSIVSDGNFVVGRSYHFIHALGTQTGSYQVSNSLGCQDVAEANILLLLSSLKGPFPAICVFSDA